MSIPVANLPHPYQVADLQPGESRRILTDLHFSAIFSQPRMIPLTLLPLLLQFDVSPGAAFVPVTGGVQWSIEEVEILADVISIDSQVASSINNHILHCVTSGLRK